MAATEQAILAGGCFWCTEAVFRDVIGVTEVESGYIGGTVPDPTYKQVCSGSTGHAEAIRVTYDPQAISREDVLDVFMGTHDPAQLNRQGNDVGTQYRSAIFVTDAEEREAAAAAIQRWNDQHPGEQAVTTIEGPAEWYAAEDYHQDFALLNPDQPYVVAHSKPKAARVCTAFPELIRQMQDLQKAEEGTSSQDSRGRNPSETSESTAP